MLLTIGEPHNISQNFFDCYVVILDSSGLGHSAMGALFFTWSASPRKAEGSYAVNYVPIPVVKILIHCRVHFGFADAFLVLAVIEWLSSPNKL